MGSKDGISSILAGVQNGRISPECRSLDVCFASAVRKTGIIYRVLKADLKVFFLIIYRTVCKCSVFCLQHTACSEKKQELGLIFSWENEEKCLWIFSLNIFANKQSMVEGYKLGLSRNNLGILSELKVSLIGVILMSL